MADLLHFTALLRDWRAGEGPLYARLAEHLRGQVRAGRLVPGDPLPPERTLAALLGVSRSTVVGAYDDLAAEGWVTRRVGSGTRVAAGAPRATGMLTLRTPLAPGAGASPDKTYDFTIAVPLLSPGQEEELHTLSQGARYGSLYQPLGLPELRARLAEIYAQEGLPTTPEQVIVTSGAQQAIALVAAALLRRGDSALVETPTYFGAIDVFRAQGAELVGLPVGEAGVRAADLARLVREHAPRLAFLTPTFHNPTGTVLPAAERAEVARLTAGLDLPLIEDDTLHDLGFEEEAPPRIAGFERRAPVVNVGSLSKLYWAGLRVGWLRAPEGLLAPLAQAKTLQDFGSSVPAQHLALRLLEDLPRLRRERRSAVQPARDLLAALLRERLPDWRVRLPGGGQYLWAELPTRAASAFTHHAARHGVRLFPGASMGVTPLPDSFLRLPFTLAPEDLPEAVRRLALAWAEFQARPDGERLA